MHSSTAGEVRFSNTYDFKLPCINTYRPQIMVVRINFRTPSSYIPKPCFNLLPVAIPETSKISPSAPTNSIVSSLSWHVIVAVTHIPRITRPALRRPQTRSIICIFTGRPLAISRTVCLFVLFCITDDAHTTKRNIWATPFKALMTALKLPVKSRCSRVWSCWIKLSYTI